MTAETEPKKNKPIPTIFVHINSLDGNSQEQKE